MTIAFAPVRFTAWITVYRCDGDGGTPGFGSMNAMMFMPLYSAKYRQLVCHATTGLPRIVARSPAQAFSAALSFASKARAFASYTAAFFGSSSVNLALNILAIRRP